MNTLICNIYRYFFLFLYFPRQLISVTAELHAFLISFLLFINFFVHIILPCQQIHSQKSLLESKAEGRMEGWNGTCIHTYNLDFPSSKELLKKKTCFPIRSFYMEIFVQFTVWHCLHQFQALQSLHFFTRMIPS